jgi:hypothetical protein
MCLERDARGVADRELGAVRELRSFEPVACRIDARRREVHAGRARRTRLNQPEQQTATPTTELEHRPAGRVERQERIAEPLRDGDQAWILAFRQALGHLGVEMARDPGIGRTRAARLLRIVIQIHQLAFAIFHRTGSRAI